MIYPEPYLTWQNDMRKSLQAVYTEEEANIIVKWWDSISAKTEYEWFGMEFVDKLNKSFFPDFTDFDKDEYRNWTARLWLYSRNILEEHKKHEN